MRLECTKRSRRGWDCSNLLVARQEIATLGRSKAWRTALEIFDALPGALQETSVFNAAASACTRGFAWIQALHLLEAIPEAALQADVLTLNSADFFHPQFLLVLLGEQLDLWKAYGA
eukprot:s170_g23.t1